MSKRRCTDWLRSSSKRQKTEESSNEEAEFKDNYFTRDEINKLPDQVVVIIFELLSARDRICIERVCKRWNKLSQCSWSKFHCFSFKDEDLYKLLMKNHRGNATKLFSRCGKWLKLVSIDRSPVYYNLLSIFGTYCPNLETVDFNGAELSKYKSSLKFFSINCHKLKSVSFDCCFPEVNIDSELGDFFVNAPNLTSLTLCAALKLKGRCFTKLTSNLKQLKLIRCPGMEDEFVRILVNHCSKLEVLNINWCNQITESCFGYICEKLTELQILHASSFKPYSNDINLSKALSSLGQIRQLDLSHNYDWVNDETLKIISRACPNLLILSISYCFYVSDNGLSHISRLQYLSELHLDECLKITDDGVTMLAHQQNHLEKLDLSWCQNVSDKSVVEFAKKWYSNLKMLKLFGCKNVTNASIRTFFNTVGKRTAVLELDVRRTSVSPECNRKGLKKKKKLQHPLLSITYDNFPKVS